MGKEGGGRPRMDEGGVRRSKVWSWRWYCPLRPASVSPEYIYLIYIYITREEGMKEIGKRNKRLHSNTPWAEGLLDELVRLLQICLRSLAENGSLRNGAGDKGSSRNRAGDGCLARRGSSSCADESWLDLLELGPEPLLALHALVCSCRPLAGHCGR